MKCCCHILCARAAVLRHAGSVFGVDERTANRTTVVDDYSGIRIMAEATLVFPGPS